MSDNFIRLIPTDPNFVPDLVAQERARDLFASFVPAADQVTAVVSEMVEFVDPGNNLEQVLCPACGADLLDGKRWQQLMDRSYKTHFSDLMIMTPCCGSVTSLNDLQYNLPAGFARFILNARNPNVRDLDPAQIKALEQILECRVRRIWSHI